MDKYITFLCSNDNGLTWFAWYKLTNTIWSVYEPEARHLTTEQLENNEPGYTRCIPIPYDTSNSIKFNDNPVPSLDSLENKLKAKLREIVNRKDSDKEPRNIYLNGALDCFNILKTLQNGVETAKAQPEKCIENEFLNLMLNHAKLRNSDEIKSKTLYHKLLDWEKDLVKFMTG